MTIPMIVQAGGVPPQTADVNALMNPPSDHFLDSLHPIYAREAASWYRLEKLARGGRYVRDELARFKFEDGTDAQAYTHGLPSYVQRQQQASYLNMPDMLLTSMMGQLMRHAPKPGADLDFAELGEVKRSRQNAVDRAELLYYNTDGIGVYGSQWDPFWCMGVMKRAGVTGHRWCVIETPRVRPGQPAPTLADERKGFRPYVVDHSPLTVTNWHDEDGKLKFAILRVAQRTIQMNGDVLVNGARGLFGYLLYVAEGFTDLGPQYRQGGWWRFDANKNPTSSSDETRQSARSGWDATLGEIPMFPVFYERYSGTRLDPAMSRSAIDDLAQLSVAHMNLTSARHYDAWDAASSIHYLLGAPPDVHREVVRQYMEGSKIVGVPPVETPAGTQVIPTLYDGSTGAVSASVFDMALKDLREQARELSALEATSQPQSSGLSKRAGFGEMKAPRLALIASELETAQNTALHFLAQRWGVQTPSAHTIWTREFDILPMLDRLAIFFEAQNASTVHSPTATKLAMRRVVEETGITSNDAELTTIEGEYEAQGQANAQAQLADRAILNQFMGGRSGSGAPPFAGNKLPTGTMPSGTAGANGSGAGAPGNGGPPGSGGSGGSGAPPAAGG